ncbi:MAG TPA: hypothetical protein VMN82_05640 [Thermoanaerobaculia bacterium]|nr:hypothetical protein [Thermoanaerobaculia bacterium]
METPEEAVRTLTERWREARREPEGLVTRLAGLEAEDYLYLGLGAFAYYYFAGKSLQPEALEAKPLNQASYAALRFASALVFFRALKDSSLMPENAAVITTFAGVVGIEWYLRTRKSGVRAEFPPAVGWWGHHDQSIGQHHHGWHSEWRR